MTDSSGKKDNNKDGCLDNWPRVETVSANLPVFWSERKILNTVMLKIYLSVFCYILWFLNTWDGTILKCILLKKKSWKADSFSSRFFLTFRKKCPMDIQKVMKKY